MPRLFDPRYQLLFRYWLVQQGDANARRAWFEGRIAAAGHHQSGRHVTQGAQMLEKIKPRHAGHVLVDQKAMGFCG